MKKQVEDWLHFAVKDLAALKLLSSNLDLSSVAAFHAQQALEKVFKAVIAAGEGPVPRLHNLLTLYAQARALGAPEIDLEEVARINLVYVDTRYPSEAGLLPEGQPSMETVTRFLVFVQGVMERYTDFLSK